MMLMMMNTFEIYMFCCCLFNGMNKYCFWLNSFIYIIHLYLFYIIIINATDLCCWWWKNGIFIMKSTSNDVVAKMFLFFNKFNRYNNCMAMMMIIVIIMMMVMIRSWEISIHNFMLQIFFSNFISVKNFFFVLFSNGNW